MAETPRDVLLPSLLDRLTDDEPERKQESGDHRTFSLRQLRASVLRDLAWLLNSGSLEVTDDFSDYPLVASSVINYGVRDFTGHLASSLDADTVAREVEEAIRRFEPRIMPKTLKVRAEVSTDLANRNALVFEIAGELWGEPMPETLRVKTLLDLETGEFSINRDGAD